MVDSAGSFGPEHGALVGLICLGVVGALIGLFRGLWIYPPTAWFALIEVGLPAALLGALAGGVVGLAVRRAERRKRRRGEALHRSS